ncbi:MAG: hypothetical protein HFI07_08050 [Lachnospiraceae bacterium]|nr:hypothetical protein [Lachnospiraceae bacterium]
MKQRDGWKSMRVFLLVVLTCVMAAAGVIENLTFEVEIKPIKTYGSGGIVNYNFGTIRDCEVYGTIPACYNLLISPLNLLFDDSYRVLYQDGKRIWLEGGIPDRDLRLFAVGQLYNE